MEEQEVRENSEKESHPVGPGSIVFHLELPAGTMVLIKNLSAKRPRQTQ